MAASQHELPLESSTWPAHRHTNAVKQKMHEPEHLEKLRRDTQAHQCRGMIALSTAENMSLKVSLMGKISGSQDCMPNDKKIEGGLQGLHCINPIALGNASIVPNDTQKQ